MDYKQIAVYKERELKKQNERLKILLYNALDRLELLSNIDWELEEIGMSKAEYKKIMNS